MAEIYVEDKHPFGNLLAGDRIDHIRMRPRSRGSLEDLFDTVSAAMKMQRNYLRRLTIETDYRQSKWTTYSLKNYAEVFLRLPNCEHLAMNQSYDECVCFPSAIRSNVGKLKGFSIVLTGQAKMSKDDLNYLGRLIQRMTSLSDLSLKVPWNNTAGALFNGGAMSQTHRLKSLSLSGYGKFPANDRHGLGRLLGTAGSLQHLHLSGTFGSAAMLKSVSKAVIGGGLPVLRSLRLSLTGYWTVKGKQRPFCDPAPLLAALGQRSWFRSLDVSFPTSYQSEDSTKIAATICSFIHA